MSDFQKGALVRDAIPFLKVAVPFLFHFFLSLELNAVVEETLITAEDHDCSVEGRRGERCLELECRLHCHLEGRS